MFIVGYSFLFFNALVLIYVRSFRLINVVVYLIKLCIYVYLFYLLNFMRCLDEFLRICEFCFRDSVRREK